MAEEKDPERMDAPNQQAVGQPPPWEEGTGGHAADPTEHAEEETRPAEKPRVEETKPPARKGEKR